MTTRIHAWLARSLYLFALGFATTATGLPQERQWIGEFRLGDQATSLILHDRTALKDAPTTVDLPTMGAREVPLTRFESDQDGMRFQLDGPPGRFEFEGRQRAGAIEGKVRRGDVTGTFTLVETRLTDVAMAAAYSGSYEVAPGHIIDVGPMGEAGGLLVFLDHASLRQGPLLALSATRFGSGPTIGVLYPFAIEIEFLRDADGDVTGLRWHEGGREVLAKKIAPHRVEEVTVTNGDVVLKGTLLLPATPGPHPAVVFAHGSGAATRNVATWNVYFVRLGMAVLSLDKRGAGDSTGDWQAASMEDIAGDWLAGMELLKQRRDIDPERIGVHGSSQGGWTAPLMAARSDDIAFVIVRAGSGVSMREQMAYEVGWTVREAGLTEADALEAEAASRTAIDLASRADSWAETEAFANTHKNKPWFSHAWPLAMSEDGWGRPWVAKNAGFDATESLRKVRVPVLWFLADLDHNVPADASERALLAALRESEHPDFEVVRLPRTGHAFTASDTGNNRDLDKQSHMVAGYWDAMERWLRKRGFNGD